MKNLLLYLVLAAALSFPAARAATLTVTSTADDGFVGTLRRVLAGAADGATIDFSVTGTIMLTTGQLLVDKSVEILGPGANSLAIDGNAASRVFYIASGKTVSISGLTITNGSADLGGGIYHDHSTLTESSCTLSANSATGSTATGLGSGVGIYNAGEYGGATLSVSATTFTNNSATNGNVGGGGRSG